MTDKLKITLILITVYLSCLHFVTFTCNTGAVNQKIERLESSKQSTEDKVNLLQGD